MQIIPIYSVVGVGRCMGVGMRGVVALSGGGGGVGGLEGDGGVKEHVGLFSVKVWYVSYRCCIKTGELCSESWGWETYAVGEERGEGGEHGG